MKGGEKVIPLVIHEAHMDLLVSCRQMQDHMKEGGKDIPLTVVKEESTQQLKDEYARRYHRRSLDWERTEVDEDRVDRRMRYLLTPQTPLPIDSEVTLQIEDYQKRLKKDRDDSFDTESAAIARLKTATRAFYSQLNGTQKNDLALLVRMAGLGPAFAELTGTKMTRNEPENSR